MNVKLLNRVESTVAKGNAMCVFRSLELLFMKKNLQLIGQQMWKENETQLLKNVKVDFSWKKISRCLAFCEHQKPILYRVKQFMKTYLYE